MTITPFLTLIIRRKKDALAARRHARRVANLLSYSPSDQACIAAGAFVIACQALTLRKEARLNFQIEDRQLRVFAEPLKAEPANRISGLLKDSGEEPLFHLRKPLPADQTRELCEQDLGWLVNTLQASAPEGLFEEIVKQNQEILMLLSELRLCRATLTTQEEKVQNPHAA